MFCDIINLGDNMNIFDIVNNKDKGIELSYDELDYVVDGYLNSIINDDEMTLFLRSVLDNDMTDKEIFDLTNIFINSGDILSFDFDYVDKHSTGGVGDKTTLIVAPLVASCGVNVLKMSGRGLGHTGGTIDKLESIDGFKVELSKDEIKENINNINIAIISQTGNIVPADKKIYALRDVTDTVSSIPLIASSIMSKKIASGAKNIVIDLKVGSGALIKNIEEAKRLSSLMIKIGNYFDKKVVCVITNMDFPLGNAIGNTLEVLESIEILNNKGNKNLREVSIVLASYMVSLSENISYEEALKEVEENLNNKKAFNKFLELIKTQGGDINNLSLSLNENIVVSNKEGYITEIDALKFGLFVRELGAGRIHKDDIIDHSVGVVLLKNINDYVKKGEPIYKIYFNKEYDYSLLNDAIKISEEKIEYDLIKEIIV
jgi:pyrimidine-nucleoside phosphorylase